MAWHAAKNRDGPNEAQHEIAEAKREVDALSRRNQQGLAQRVPKERELVAPFGIGLGIREGSL